MNKFKLFNVITMMLRSDWNRLTLIGNKLTWKPINLQDINKCPASSTMIGRQFCANKLIPAKLPAISSVLGPADLPIIKALYKLWLGRLSRERTGGDKKLKF